MTFPGNVYLAAGVSSCLATAIAAPLLRRWCLRTGLVDDPGHRKIHTKPIPLAGGLAVLTGLLLPMFAAFLFLLLKGDLSLQIDVGGGWAGLLGYGMSRRGLQVISIFLGAVAITLVGWLDDRHELGPARKFAGQALIAFLVAACGVRITLFVPSIVFSYLVTMLWIVTVINAFNFMDNMNGLCAGLGAIAAAVFAGIAVSHEHYLVALIGFLMLGALLGFLPYNYPRAVAFLGDAGSHLTGYLLAVLSILPHFYGKGSANRAAVFSPLLVLAVPLVDLAWVVFLRWRMGLPFYVGDTNHLSHRLVRSGISKPKAVAIIWALGALGGALALLVALPKRG